MPSKKRTPEKQNTENTHTKTMRLQKALALCGWGSRRDCESLISDGRVDVDGEVVTKLGSSVDPYSQTVRVDGQNLKLPKLKYFMLNKPTGVISTAEDPAGRMRVIDLIPSDQRVFNVGRLDKSSEGLILVTNDGELANQLTHPKFGVYKTYQVQVSGTPHINELKPLKSGVRLAEGVAKVADIRIKRKQKNTTDLVIVLDEGRNREIRRLLAAVDHKVLRLKRIAIGTLKLGDLPTGAYRELTKKEVAQLKKIANQQDKSSSVKKRATKKKTVDARSVFSKSTTGQSKKRTPNKSHTGSPKHSGQKRGEKRTSATKAKRKTGRRK